MRYLLLMATLAVGGLTSCVHRECDCTPSDLFITSDTVRVESMTLSGVACESAEVQSTVWASANDGTVTRPKMFVPGALDYLVMPSATGQCTVTLTLDTGAVLERTVAFRYIAGECCSGFYADNGYWTLSTEATDGGTS